MSRSAPPLPCRRCGAGSESGFSIIELAVAGTLLGLVITGVMSLLGIGSGMGAQSLLRTQAMAYAKASLEDTSFHRKKYPVLATAIPGPAVDFNLQSGAGSPVPAKLRVTIHPEASVSWNDISGSPLNIPYQRITAEVSWTFAGLSDRVSFDRRIIAGE